MTIGMLLAWVVAAAVALAFVVPALAFLFLAAKECKTRATIRARAEDPAISRAGNEERKT